MSKNLSFLMLTSVSLIHRPSITQLKSVEESFSSLTVTRVEKFLLSWKLHSTREYTHKEQMHKQIFTDYCCEPNNQVGQQRLVHLVSPGTKIIFVNTGVCFDLLVPMPNNA